VNTKLSKGDKMLKVSLGERFNREFCSLSSPEQKDSANHRIKSAWRDPDSQVFFYFCKCGLAVRVADETIECVGKYRFKRLLEMAIY
jgi:hypothetical protein